MWQIDQNTQLSKTENFYYNASERNLKPSFYIFFITTCLHLEQRKGVIWTHKGMCEKTYSKHQNGISSFSPLLFQMLCLL